MPPLSSRSLLISAWSSLRKFTFFCIRTISSFLSLRRFFSTIDLVSSISLSFKCPLQLSSDLVTFPPTPAPGGPGGSGLILGTSDKGGDSWVLVTLGPSDTEGGDNLVFTSRPRRARKG